MNDDTNVVETKTRRQLERKYAKRLTDIVAVIKDSPESIEIAKSVMPTKQSYVAWAIENSMDAVREYAFSELGKEIVLNIQENEPGKLQAIFDELEAEPVPCVHCGELPDKDAGGNYYCNTDDCLIAENNPSLLSVSNWNELMNKFKK